MSVTTDHSERKLTLRERVAVGAATVGIIGSAMAGVFYGLPVLMEDSAYKRAHISTIAIMSDHMTDAVTSARASFMLGAAEGVDLGPALRMGLENSISRFPEFPMKDDYAKAGRSWRQAADLTDQEVVQIAQRVLAENTKLRRLRDGAIKEATAAYETPGQAQDIVTVAILRGMIGAASDVMEMDDRILGRIDKLLAKAPSEIAPLLDRVRQESASSISAEVRGNDRLFADLQNSLNAMPAEMANFRVPVSMRAPFWKREVGIRETAGLSDVEVADVAAADLDPSVSGVHEEPEGP